MLLARTLLPKHLPALTRPLFRPMTTAPSPSARLAHLRQLMASHDVGAYVVPSDDQHGSEYVADADKRREWISAFTGSAGAFLLA